MTQGSFPAGAPAGGATATERTVIAGDIRLHVVEQGTGPLVLLIHGFPETSYSWRRQLPALADAGFRAAAIDVRGYGRSSKPAAVAAYRMTELVADNVAVVRALGAESAVVVGHDWGSPIATSSALIAPEVFPAVGMLSVPYTPRGGPRPTEIFAGLGGGNEFYVSYFQDPGRAESEIEPDVRSWLRGVYTTLSADTMPAAGAQEPFFVAPGGRMADRFASGPLPGWLSADDLDRYVRDFECSGLTGGLNRYRNMDRDWEDLAPFDGAAIQQPSLFIGGSLDASTGWNQR
ncbi:MAG: alpha/beta hydrolase, partial [Nocardiopsaceae bacterium]|nr:alpha/beta hydrolase [Nocardiopsaceae bacterium]